MALTPEELQEIQNALAEHRQQLEKSLATERSRAERLEHEFGEYRSAQEAAARRAAIYGGELRDGEMTSPERKRYFVNLIGDTARAVIVAKRSGRPIEEVLRKIYKNDRAADEHLRTLQSDVFAEGGSMVQTQHSPELIELLYAQSVVRALGATALPMPQGNLSMDRVVSGATVGYVGESRTIPASQPGTGKLNLSAKKLAALVPITNELLTDTSGRVNSMVVRDLGAQMSLRQDLAFLRGDGSNNTPVGIRNTAGVTVLSAGSGLPGTPTITDVLRGLMQAVRNANALGVSLGWTFNSDWWALVYFAKATTGDYIYRSEMDAGQLMGHPFRVSNQIASNYSSSLTEVYFGDWSEFIIGETDGMRLDSSNEASYWNGSEWVSTFSADLTAFRALERHDGGLKHPATFAIATVATNLNP